jgi:hypothetical protein
MPITWNSCDSLRNVFASPGRSPAASGNRRLHRRRDIIRTLVQRIEIGREAIKIVFRRDAERTRLGYPGTSTPELSEDWAEQSSQPENS